MNKAILAGNVGKDPDIITTESGKKLARFSLATQSYRKDASGNKLTDWHNIIVWEKLADLCEKFVKKGSQLIIEGEIQYRSYDKDGVTKYITEIVGNALHFTGKKEPEKTVTKQPQTDVEAEIRSGKYEGLITDGDTNDNGLEDLPF